MDAAANITIGDVAGSGVRAAVVVGRIRSALRACTVHGLVYFRCAHRLRRRPLAGLAGYGLAAQHVGSIDKGRCSGRADHAHTGEAGLLPSAAGAARSGPSPKDSSWTVGCRLDVAVAAVGF